jgi:hypothetical protein
MGKSALNDGRVLPICCNRGVDRRCSPLAVISTADAATLAEVRVSRFLVVFCGCVHCGVLMKPSEPLPALGGTLIDFRC